MLNYSINEVEGVKLLVMSGSLTADVVAKFKSIVKQVTERESLIINFENVTLITSAGMNALVEVSTFAKDHDKRVIILWPDKELLKTAETLRVYNYLIFAQSVDEAKIKIKFFT
ncbi:MAG: STAS domain-containing protein [Spirochaetes bacterium]|nr:STAS domain-containing protein [Spirochaetota bacterium]